MNNNTNTEVQTHFSFTVKVISTLAIFPFMGGFPDCCGFPPPDVEEFILKESCYLIMLPLSTPREPLQLSW